MWLQQLEGAAEAATTPQPGAAPASKGSGCHRHTRSVLPPTPKALCSYGLSSHAPAAAWCSCGQHRLPSPGLLFTNHHKRYCRLPLLLTPTLPPVHVCVCLLQLSVVDGDSYNDNEPSSSRPRELLKGDDVSCHAQGPSVGAGQPPTSLVSSICDISTSNSACYPPAVPCCISHAHC